MVGKALGENVENDKKKIANYTKDKIQYKNQILSQSLNIKSF